MIKLLTAGESHGKAGIAILDGFPAGLPFDPQEINKNLARRQMGYGRGGRMKIEKDQIELLSGVRFGETLGSPISFQVVNRDFKNWETRMSILPEKENEDNYITRPRPGHADLPGALKFDRVDIRDILERSSARATAVLVASGSVARILLAQFGIKIQSHVINLGGIKASPNYEDLEQLEKDAENSEVRCADSQAEKEIINLIDATKEKGDTLGGIFEVIITGIPVGLGSHTSWERRLEGKIAAAMMSIQAMKGVEIGMGFEVANKPGSQIHDEIEYVNGAYRRKTNNAGGIEGGITNGEPIIIRTAMKPIPTLKIPKKSVDMKTKEPCDACFERSDVTAVPAAAVVGEAAAAWVLAEVFVEKFGGDSLKEMQNNYNSYIAQIKER